MTGDSGRTPNARRLLRQGLLVTTLALAVVWGALGWALHLKWRDAIAGEKRQATNLAHTLAEQTLRILVSVDQATRRAADARREGALDGAQLARFARETGLEPAILTQLSLVGADGRFIASDIDPQGRRTGAVDLSERAHVRVHLRPVAQAASAVGGGSRTIDGLFIGPAVVGKVSGKRTVQISRHVADAEGRSLGVIVASLGADYFASVYRVIQLGDAGGVSLIGDDGLIRSQVRGGQALEPDAAAAEHAQQLAAQVQRQGLAAQIVAREGREEITGFQRVGPYPLFLAVQTDSEQALADWKDGRDLALVVTALFSVALVIAATAVVANLTRLERARAELEVQVQSRTRSLQDALETLRSAQGQLVQAEKMASLGQLVANVAHEINTPIGAVRASGRNIADALARVLAELPELLSTLAPPTREALLALIAEASRPAAPLSSREERALLRRLTQALSSDAIGEGLADPRASAEALLHLRATEDPARHLALLRHPQAERLLAAAQDVATLVSNSENINEAVERVSKIVFALKTYSHGSRTGSGEAALQPTDLAEGLDTVLTLYQHALRQGVELQRDWAPTPPIEGRPDELNQVWTNLIHNALQAMDHQGTLSVSLHPEGDEAVVTIADTGCGIPTELRGRIFEPFFTTKPAGEGSGLGLDIARGIVARHQGRITVDSEVGVGSRFTVHLPLRQAEAAGPAGPASGPASGGSSSDQTAASRQRSQSARPAAAAEATCESTTADA